MQYKQLGNTNTLIPAIGMGTMGIGGYFSRDDTNDNQAIKVLKQGIELGMSFIDTAEAYGKGHSEELVGIATKGQRDKVVIATKVSPEHLHYDNVIASAENSLKRLRTDYIDLYQIHWPNPTIPVSETLEAMIKLQADGKIRAIGVSNFSVPELEEALLSVGNIASVQVEYNLFDRTAEQDLIPFCTQNKITVLAYTPLCSGKITYDKSKQDDLLRIAHKYNTNVSQLALKWLTENNNIVAIPMSRNASHLLSNSASTDLELNTADYDFITTTFLTEILEIPTGRIKVDTKGLDGFVPSANDLAKLIAKGVPIKPIRVVKIDDPVFEYELFEGKLRYWAWQIAYNGNVAVRALIRE
ncbi:Predicted oxidoreductase [Trichlorobacter thiogenes]|uniref:Predicted oxidoreductase n=1 Tax=Trichlorobacter thiogenes TaxID=115783 RepID=A0A1T4JX13_9BACT|nr:aldo/keto reductase [Trichlorobacter thiogenes]SJZ34654.1 Predicted oxidoreductase [Trichlorobacter thiogenes]